MRGRRVPLLLGASALALSLATSMPAFAGEADEQTAADFAERSAAGAWEDFPADGFWDRSDAGSASGDAEWFSDGSGWPSGDWSDHWSDDSRAEDFGDWSADDWEGMSPENAAWDSGHDHGPARDRSDEFHNRTEDDGAAAAAATEPAGGSVGPAAPAAAAEPAPAGSSAATADTAPTPGKASEPAAEPVPAESIEQPAEDAVASYLTELTGGGPGAALPAGAAIGFLGVLTLLGALCVGVAVTLGRLAGPSAAAQFRRDVRLALRGRRPSPMP